MKNRSCLFICSILASISLACAALAVETSAPPVNDLDAERYAYYVPESLKTAVLDIMLDGRYLISHENYLEVMMQAVRPFFQNETDTLNAEKLTAIRAQVIANWREAQVQRIYAFDSNGDGQVSEVEINETFAANNQTFSNESQKIFTLYDINHDKTITAEEAASFSEGSVLPTIQDLMLMDGNRDGTINLSEIYSVLDGYFKEKDFNQDGQIDIDDLADRVKAKQLREEKENILPNDVELQIVSLNGIAQKTIRDVAGKERKIKNGNVQGYRAAMRKVKAPHEITVRVNRPQSKVALVLAATENVIWHIEYDASTAIYAIYINNPAQSVFINGQKWEHARLFPYSIAATKNSGRDFEKLFAQVHDFFKRSTIDNFYPFYDKIPQPIEVNKMQPSPYQRHFNDVVTTETLPDISFPLGVDGRLSYYNLHGKKVLDLPFSANICCYDDKRKLFYRLKDKAFIVYDGAGNEVGTIPFYSSMANVSDSTNTVLNTVNDQLVFADNTIKGNIYFYDLNAQSWNAVSLNNLDYQVIAHEPVRNQYLLFHSFEYLLTPEMQDGKIGFFNQKETHYDFHVYNDKGQLVNIEEVDHTAFPEFTTFFNDANPFSPMNRAPVFAFNNYLVFVQKTVGGKVSAAREEIEKIYLYNRDTKKTQLTYQTENETKSVQTDAYFTMEVQRLNDQLAKHRFDSQFPQLREYGTTEQSIVDLLRESPDDLVSKPAPNPAVVANMPEADVQEILDRAMNSGQSEEFKEKLKALEEEYKQTEALEESQQDQDNGQMLRPRDLKQIRDEIESIVRAMAQKSPVR